MQVMQAMQAMQAMQKAALNSCLNDQALIIPKICY